MEYIDANKLRSEVERVKETGCESPILVCDDILMFIDHLQQEQPNLDSIKNEWYNKGYLKGRQDAHIPARELGLPKALDFEPLDFERDAVSFCFDHGLNTTPHIAKTIAKHYYELGLLRTDAFIEKACEWLRNNSHNYANNALGKEYLINDFKAYIKNK